MTEKKAAPTGFLRQLQRFLIIASLQNILQLRFVWEAGQVAGTHRSQLIRNIIAR